MKTYRVLFIPTNEYLFIYKKNRPECYLIVYSKYEIDRSSFTDIKDYTCDILFNIPYIKNDIKYTLINYGILLNEHFRLDEKDIPNIDSLFDIEEIDT